MKPLLIVNVGSAPEKQLSKFGDFELWAKLAIGETSLDVAFHDGIHTPIPDNEMLAGVVIMGSLSMVTEEADWMKRLASEIRQLCKNNIPVLGICFGHQLLAYAFGGQAGFNPNGLEVGTVEITRNKESENDPIFSTLPKQFLAQTIHFQSVLTLPENAVCLAESVLDNHHSFRIGSCVWGVQFHPEFSAEIMEEMLNNVAETLGQDRLTEKKQQIRATDNARQILVQFARLCADRLNG
ncbi:glutamine amidotransferase [Vibrio albus]|uniref:Glutamine amidotransferase n=1 Tax=Vibrio albus TaxID=2200953 RepID=A0A2U3B6D0_9VIBR|nr:glutamine amidotransferase [Vibrio albus]PWI32356.1 glutamine amidotransferase [Vibrio albus]